VARDRANRLSRAPALALALWAGICASAVLARAAAATAPVAPSVSAASVPQPRIISRAQWGADESLRFDRSGKEIWPRTFWPIQKIIVHHTQTQNNDPDPAGTIRAIYRDDARTEGLGDISYNFLIDEEGRIYEGRYSRPYAPDQSPTGQDQYGNGVTAGHAYGHNAGTVGIALLGSLNRLDAPPQARAALERLVAWIVATHHIDPIGASVYHNPITGAQGTFPNIAGHRDVNQTDCPGNAFYPTLPGIRVAVAGLLAGKPLPPTPKQRRRSRAQVKRGTRRAERQRRREERAIERVLRRHPVVFAGGKRGHEVALAFHDGPGPYTPKVVEALSQMHAPATFFEIGDSIIYFSDATIAADDRGFEIGNLTESFAPVTKLSARAQRREIREQGARVRSLGIPSPRLFSPPYGGYNRKTLAVLRRLHMLMVLWSVDTQDYKRPGVRTIVHAALRRARPGSIILLHDGGGDRTQTIEALPAIVHGLRSRGYRLVTVPRLMLDDPPRP
jgi:peptidoglycan/xylan/chitin deacetylase (PgdA/CDA1 family)